jgi:hypothetical protein
MRGSIITKISRRDKTVSAGGRPNPQPLPYQGRGNCSIIPIYNEADTIDASPFPTREGGNCSIIPTYNEADTIDASPFPTREGGIAPLSASGRGLPPK